MMPQKELPCVEESRVLRKLAAGKPGVSAETAGARCSALGALLTQMLPKGESERFFLLLGGIYRSPLGTVKVTSPAVTYLNTSCTSKAHQTAIALQTYQSRYEDAPKGGGSEPPHLPSEGHPARPLHEGGGVGICIYLWPRTSFCTTAFHLLEIHGQEIDAQLLR